MSNLIGIVGQSGTGKSTSYGQIPSLGIKGLDPKETVIINVAGKSLPFKGWKKNYTPFKGKEGNYLQTYDWKLITKAIETVSASRPEIKNIILEDAQYILAFEFMNRAGEGGYKKFADIGVHFNKIRDAATIARDDLKIFALWHPEIDNEGKMKMKTVGKMVDDYLTPEGLFTVILYSKVDMEDKKPKYSFVTNNDGQYPAKSPIGMFEDLEIPNDLGFVADAIDEYENG